MGQINGRHGGGVLIYIADHLVCTNRTEYQSEYYEHIWVDVKVKSSLYAIRRVENPKNQFLNPLQVNFHVYIYVKQGNVF